MLADNGTVSERHAAARADDSKLTAGELATAMRRAGMRVTARELQPFATEWHHAGWNPKGGMGRCYFFAAADATPDGMARLFGRVESARAAAAQPRFGWRVSFRKDYSGPYGRKRHQPIAELREFAPGERVPDKYELISSEEYVALLPHNGADLLPFESRAAFARRMAAAAGTGV